MVIDGSDTFEEPSKRFVSSAFVDFVDLAPIASRPFWTRLVLQGNTTDEQSVCARTPARRGVDLESVTWGSEASVFPLGRLGVTIVRKSHGDTV